MAHLFGPAALLNYEVCYLNPEGRLTMFYAASCCDDRDAVTVARSQVRGGFGRVQVWRGLLCVADFLAEAYEESDRTIRSGDARLH